MKKRILAMIFALVMACGVVGCSGTDEYVEHEQEQQKQEVVADDAASQFLQSLPAEISEESAISEGFYTINSGVVSNQEIWDAFMEAVENDEEAEVVICQYTTKGGAVLDYVTHHADGTIDVVTDATRDGYSDEKSIVKPVETYTDLKVFENFSLKEGGTAYTICVLSDNPELTADDFRTYWIEMTTEENGVYMLYVI